MPTGRGRRSCTRRGRLRVLSDRAEGRGRGGGKGRQRKTAGKRRPAGRRATTRRGAGRRTGTGRGEGPEVHVAPRWQLGVLRVHGVVSCRVAQSRMERHVPV